MIATQVIQSPSESETERDIAAKLAAEKTHTDRGWDAQIFMRVFGDYQLIKKIGQGAMATVYKAQELSFDRFVALKLLHKNIAQNPKLVERFYREARVMGSLDHPNIVQGYGVGEVDGIHYFAMEYVSGKSLQWYLNSLGRLDVGDALFIAVKCAEALEYAHTNGLIHRDIKPENILITKRSVVKVADLGMVKLQDEDMALTQTGHAVGTPWFMPLEQAKNSKDVDGRCDIYALGCTLHCMVTGKAPFVGENIVEVIQMKEVGTFPPARHVNPDVPERLDLIIAKMTAKLSKNRYSSCGELLLDLRSLGLASRSLHLQQPRSDSDETPDLLRAESAAKITPPPPDLWFVRVKTDAGVLMQKHKTIEIIHMVESGEIPPSSQVSRSEKTGFRSLATFKEFKPVALAKAARRGIDQQTVRYRSLYRKIEEANEQREQSHTAQDELDENIDQTLRTGVIVTLAVMGGVLQFGVVISLFHWLF